MVTGQNLHGTTGLDGPFRRGYRRGFVEGIDVIELSTTYHNSHSFARRALGFLRYAVISMWFAVILRADIVFATTTPLTAGLPGLAARWLRGRRFVFEVRDLWPELPRAMGVIRNPIILALLSALEWACYRSAHRLVALSPGIADGIARRGVPRERIALVPNGCDLDIFQDPDLKPWRPDVVSETDLLAIFTGAHGRANGLEAVLDAAAVLKARSREDIVFFLVGEGQSKPALQARAQAEDLSQVHFSGLLPKPQIARLMAGADIGLQCLANIPAFYHGTSPNKFFDYIAAGLPAVNNYPGWLADMIVEHDCGYCVPPQDAAAFADALEAAADAPQDRQHKGQRAIALARAEFDRTDLARTWCAWVLGAAAPSPPYKA